MQTKTTIEAAGGIVTDDLGRVLMIFRHGHWDLPKGKLEFGESIEECAVREVEEECGVGGLRVIGRAGTTEHTYFEGGTEILKRTYWYRMRCSGGALVAQREEGIESAEWVSLEEVKKRLPLAYSTISDLLTQLFFSSK